MSLKLRYLFIIFLLCHSILMARPMGYEDIVTISKPQYLVLSPDNSYVAFVARKGCLEKNRNMDTLYIKDINSKKSKTVFVSDRIIQVAWGKESSTCYFLHQEEDKYQIVRHNSKGISILTSGREPVETFALAPDESTLYYTITKSTSAETIKQYQEQGYVYEWDRDMLPTLLDSKFHHREKEEIWSLDLRSSKNCLITSLPYTNWLDDQLVNGLQVSENGDSLLFSINRLGRPDLGGVTFSKEVAVWDIAHKYWSLPPSQSILGKHAPTWINGTQFVFLEKPSAIWIYDIKSKKSSKLDWFSTDKIIGSFFWDKNNKNLYGVTSSSLIRILLEEKRSEPIEIPIGRLFISPSFDKEAHLAAYVAESSNSPPEIAVYNFDTGKSVCLTKLNPQLADISHGYVEKIVEQTKEGLPIKGYLVHPVNEQPGKLYPIIIATYGFCGQYIADAEWHSSFPAQTLAAEGYFVLLLNHVGMSQGLVGDSTKAREIEGWNTLKIFEEAIDLVAKKGGDPTKVGLYGWSHGGFTVNFLISHSQKFHVACQGEGADYNPGGFWLIGNLMWPRIYENMFGGPPWGDSLQNYLDYSPFFQIDKIHTPLLLEYVHGIGAFEMYVPLRYLKVPAELVVYDGEEHNFAKPKARIASMTRKVDWFNYWLFNKRDPDFSKQQQYSRWDQMRLKQGGN